MCTVRQLWASVVRPTVHPSLALLKDGLTNYKSSSWIKTLPPPPTSPLLTHLVWVLGFLFSHLRLLGIVVS